MKRMIMWSMALIWLIFAVAIPAGAQEATPSASPAVGGGDVESAAEWLIDQQREDGAFAGFS